MSKSLVGRVTFVDNSIKAFGEIFVSFFFVFLFCFFLFEKKEKKRKREKEAT
jgi:predicted PurR-regulated permease PerM